MNKPLTPDTEQVNRIFTSRVIILGLCMFLGLTALIARYGYLQVYAHDKYTTQADNNRIKLISAPPSRGYIYDRNGVILADNQPVFTAMLSPDEVEDPERTLNLLAPIFDLTDENISEYIIPCDKVVDYLPKISVSEKQAIRFCNGGQLSLDRVRYDNFQNDGLYRVYYEDKFLGLGQADLGQNLLKIECLVGQV